MFTLCRHCFLKQTVLQNGKSVTSLLYVGRLLKLLNYSYGAAAVFSLFRLTCGRANPVPIQNRSLFENK